MVPVTPVLLVGCVLSSDLSRHDPFQDSGGPESTDIVRVVSPVDGEVAANPVTFQYEVIRDGSVVSVDFLSEGAVLKRSDWAKVTVRVTLRRP